MLKLTGFVLPDVGILTITAMVNKTDPAAVTQDDLDWIADYLEMFYKKGIGNSLAAGVAFAGTSFAQPELQKPQFADKLKAYANFVLRGHQHLDLNPILELLGKKDYRQMVLRDAEQAPLCAFTGQQAYLRVSRSMFPMINGRGVMNFGPMGEAGLPVSDVILLAIHALPLGCVITQGALLAVESDDRGLMFEFVKANLENNKRFIQLANQNGYEKFPNLSSYKTRLMNVLVEALGKQSLKWGDNHHAPSLNAYHFSNYGSNARMTVYALPSSTVQFVWEAGKGEHAAAWQRIIAGGRTQDKDESEELRQKAPKLTQRNLIWEDLFDLPEDARRFLRTYFLRQPLRLFKQDPRSDYNSFAQADLISWDLTALFLKRIMNMEKDRIDQLRILGDRLADYIQQQDDRKLLRTLYQERRYHIFRMALLRAMNDYSRRASAGSEPLVSFDGYVKIFEEGDEFERIDWNLARDLLLIRIFEQLHQHGYLSQVSPELQENEEAEETA
jgi:CRISPR-associated protein Cst1